MTALFELPAIPHMTETLSLSVGAPRTRFAQDPEAILRELGAGCALITGPLASVTLDPFAIQVWHALNDRASATIPELTARFAPGGDDLHVPTRRFVYQLVMALLARGLIHMAQSLPTLAVEKDDISAPPSWWPTGG